MSLVEVHIDGSKTLLAASALLTLISVSTLTIAATGTVEQGHPLSQIVADTSLNMQGYQIENVGSPDESSDSATKGYVDSNTGGTSANVHIVTGSRFTGTTYTNNYGTPIFLSAWVGGSQDNYIECYVDGKKLTRNMDYYSYTSNTGGTCTAVVPNGSTYKVESSDGVSRWVETEIN